MYKEFSQYQLDKSTYFRWVTEYSNPSKTNFIKRYKEYNKDYIPPKPISIKVNPLDVLASELLSDRNVVDAWIKESPTLIAFFSGVTRDLEWSNIEALKQVVSADVDNESNPLTIEVGDKLLLILNTLQAQVKEPN